MNNDAKLLYGVAYYHEYLPYERIEKDIAMMKDAGITVVRIAESTWSTLEPQDGVFDFSHIDAVLDGMHAAGIGVIVGTPTYAIPTWLARLHPECLAVTAAGRNRYGPRQNMDITSPAYLRYAERVIRTLLGHVCAHPAIIGYQADNETKHYMTAGPNVQSSFVKYLKEKFASLDDLNRAWGLDYWSNRINAWEDFPETHASINFSLTSEFAAFQRGLVTDFLSWQAGIIREYLRPGQFITHNFDFEWRGHSYGIQPMVDHFAAAKTFTVAGCDVYHPSQDQLTGIEISLCGDLTRSLKKDNYLVLETEAQAFLDWVPYPGQLRLQAFAHVACGARMVEYWHWHSIHNSFETYWKGLLSHDFLPNPAYGEAKTIGADFRRLGSALGDARTETRVAMLVSNRALTALNAFKPFQANLDYNDVVRRYYDELYRLSVSCDFIDAENPDFGGYSVLIVPSLYCAPDALLERLNRFVASGGHIVYGVRGGFADQDVKVRTCVQPGVISEVCGVTYSQFVRAENVPLAGLPAGVSGEESRVSSIAELLVPAEGTEIIARYDHRYWGQYAAITRRRTGSGSATYFGCLPQGPVVRVVLAEVLRSAGLWGPEQEIGWPVITKRVRNGNGRIVRFYLNFSPDEREIRHVGGDGSELLSGRHVLAGGALRLEPWGAGIVEEKAR